MPPRAGLAVDRTRVPLRDVGELAGEVPALLVVACPDHRVHAHRDVAAAGLVDRGTDLVHPPHEVAEGGYSVLSAKYGRDELTGLSRAADRAVVVRTPRHAIEVRRGEDRAIRLAQSGGDRTA